MQLLNSGLWWKGESGSYYNGSTTATTVNFANYKLSDKAKSFISTSRYYLGGSSNIRSSTTGAWYIYERGTDRYDTSRPLYWDGMVGLMYLSDLGYASGVMCENKSLTNSTCLRSWLHYNSVWLMSPNSDNSGYVNYFGGKNFASLTVDNSNSIYPTFYLTSTTSIIDGDGSLNNPYLLK